MAERTLSDGIELVEGKTVEMGRSLERKVEAFLLMVEVSMILWWL